MLTKLEERTQIDVKTETNIAFFIFLPTLPLGVLSTAVQHKPYDFLTAGFMSLVVVLIILGIDRMAKNMLIAGFEEDFGIGDD